MYRIISIINLLVLMFVGKAQGQIIPDLSPDKARFIYRVDSIMGDTPGFNNPPVKKDTPAARAKKIQGLKQLYKENKNSFSEIAILNSLIDLHAVDSVRKIARNDLWLEFAQKLEEGDAVAETYINQVNDPGRKAFLKSWLSYRKLHDGNALQGEPKTRIEAIGREYVKLKNDLAGLSARERINKLFDVVQNWKEIMECEAAIILISEAYEANSSEISQRLKNAIQNNTPATMPPPYNREHTNFHMLSLLAKSLGDKQFIQTFEKLKNSGVKYTADIAADVLLWLQSNTRYPLEYHELIRTYHSRS